MRSKKESGAGWSSLRVAAHEFSAPDYEMLRAGRQLVDETVDVFAVAATDVLVLIDATDRVGAEMLRANMVARGMGTTETATMIQTLVQPPGGRPAGHRPLVALWASKRFILPFLADLGFDVPSGWSRALDAPAPHGHIFTLLKRGDSGVLCTIDYADVETREGPAVSVGGGRKRNIQ